MAQGHFGLEPLLIPRMRGHVSRSIVSEYAYSRSGTTPFFKAAESQLTADSRQFQKPGF
jgi:hypothetical protein